MILIIIGLCISSIFYFLAIFDSGKSGAIISFTMLIVNISAIYYLLNQ